MTAETATVAIPPPIIRRQQLTVEELKSLQFPLKIQGNSVIIEYTLRNWRLQNPVVLNLEKVLAAKEKGLIEYILKAFISERPGLLTFVFDNQSIIKMARHFLRHCSGSLESCCVYTASIQRYSTWLGFSPDMIIQDVKPIGNIPDPIRVKNHIGHLNAYLAELQDDGLKPGPVNNHIKSVKTFY
jgi:hypothetical protein